MQFTTVLRVASACTLALSLTPGAASAKAPAKVEKAAIAKAVKSEMAEEIAGINAHDLASATKWEAQTTISMEAGRPPSDGLKDYREGLGMALKGAPSWRLRMIDETVDVADAGDMAIYRSTYWQDSDAEDRTPMTEKVNYIACFKKEKDGAWKIAWSVVAAQERPHKR